jgi:hypothetical protein
MSQMYYVGPMEEWTRCLVPSIAGLAPLMCFRACPFAHRARGATYYPR